MASKQKFPHCAEALQYAKDVVAKRIPACKWVRLACKRHLDDLKRWKGKGAPFYFSEEAGERVCKFIELLPHVKGEWARRGETLKLQPWQKFVLVVAFGWLRPDGTRRFRTVYIEVPRKNAKSTMSSGVALYMLGPDGEVGAEVYSAATTRDQARIVFQDAQAMARKDPELRAHFGLEVGAHAVWSQATGSRMQALSADGGTLDGLNIHCAVVDELHAHKTRAVYDVLETGTGSRSQPLLWNITTAGSNRAGICYEVRTYLTKLLEGVAQDETFFGVIWTIDDGDDWASEEAWKKANPNYGVSLYPDDFARLARKAMEMPSATNNFLTKRLNVWVNADTAWMDMRAWDKCADQSLTLEQFEGQPCRIALDLASKVDIAAKLTLFERDVEGKGGKLERHYYAFGRYYLPEEAAEDGRNSQYGGWSREGRLVLTPGNVIDFEYIKDDLRQDASRFEVKEVPYDPFQATQLSTELQSEGFPMVEMRPTVLNFSEPMKELEKLVLSGRFHHDGCPVLTWMISNVVCHMDNKDNVYPRKERPENKIDGAVALIMALGRAMTVQPDETITQGFVEL